MKNSSQHNLRQHLRLATAALIVCAYSSSAMAEQRLGTTDLKRHTLELRGNFGGIEGDGDEGLREVDEIDTAHFGLGYWFNLNENFSVGAGYLNGESDDFDLTFFSLFEDTTLDYDAFTLGLEGRLPLGRENYLFARANAAFYDFDVIDDSSNDTLTSDDGTGFQFAAGWTKKFRNGLGVEAMYEFISMGDDLEISSIGVGLTYSF